MKRVIALVVAAGFAAALFTSCPASHGDSQDPQDYEVGYCGEPVPANSVGGVDRTDENLVYFPAAKLASYIGGEVRSLKVCYSAYSSNPATHGFDAVLYGKGTASSPGAKLFDAARTLTKGWNEIELDSPIAIDAGTELWAGYSTNMKGCWPLGFDGEASVPDVYFVKYGGGTTYEEIDAANNICVRLIVRK
jgi:hypothetical protein